MQSIRQELEEQGIPAKNIAYIDLDKYGFRSVKSPGQLESLIEPALAIPGMKHLFIDEIQNAKGFEKVLNEFRNESGFSIFATGSSSCPLSSELATKLTGRYIEFEVQMPSFQE